MRIVHISDIHVWKYAFSIRRLFSKQTVGLAELFMGRARRFRLERLADVVGRIREIRPDHILISGDLTTLGMTAEFEKVRDDLLPLLGDPSRITVIPGNHDRYTSGAVREKRFEVAFGEFAPRLEYPWLRYLDDQTAILGLDPTRHDITARGLLPAKQLAEAQALIANEATRPKRLIVACHYPLAAPPLYQMELWAKRMVNAPDVAQWLNTVGPHLYCCGHVHVAWAFFPPEIPEQLCLDPGAPLFEDPRGIRKPGFYEIELDGDGVEVRHHIRTVRDWTVQSIYRNSTFFRSVLDHTPAEPPDGSTAIPGAAIAHA